MIRFNSDYQEGAHPRILQRLLDVNYVQNPGYGQDDFCARAEELIRAQCLAPEADVHFLVGGTQTNLTFLDAALRSYQGVLCADTAHIHTHETGAVEATGHKLLALAHQNGKVAAGQISEYCREYFSSSVKPHMVMPKVVYISNPTELGTIYSRDELLALRGVCDHWNLCLYMDGARLGYGLASPENELDLPFIAKTCDAFYIGGTKQGALFGEALVIVRDELKQDFRYFIKQKGAMLAKGWLLGLQFEELFRDGLYLDLSRHAVELALRLKAALRERNVPFLVDSPTNQQFPILPDGVLKRLDEAFSYSYQERVDAEHSAVRFCTSWATRGEDVDAFIGALKALL